MNLKQLNHPRSKPWRPAKGSERHTGSPRPCCGRTTRESSSGWRHAAQSQESGSSTYNPWQQIITMLIGLNIQFSSSFGSLEWILRICINISNVQLSEWHSPVFSWNGRSEHFVDKDGADRIARDIGQEDGLRCQGLAEQSGAHATAWFHNPTTPPHHLFNTSVTTRGVYFLLLTPNPLQPMHSRTCLWQTQER